MTGCGCAGVVALLVALIVLFVRGSFDSGEPIQQALAFAACLGATELWRRERSANELVRARGA